MDIVKYEEIKSKLIKYDNQFVIIDSDVAKLYGITTREVNQAVVNNVKKFPSGYILELSKEKKQEVIKNFDHLSSLKYSPYLPKVFTEKGLYMLATIIKSEIATQTTIDIIETFSKVKELSRHLNDIIKTEDEDAQKEFATKSNKILEEIIEIEADSIADDEEGEIIETTTNFEINIGFAKVSKSIKRVKK